MFDRRLCSDVCDVGDCLCRCSREARPPHQHDCGGQHETDLPAAARTWSTPGAREFAVLVFVAVAYVAGLLHGRTFGEKEYFELATHHELIAASNANCGKQLDDAWANLTDKARRCVGCESVVGGGVR